MTRHSMRKSAVWLVFLISLTSPAFGSFHSGGVGSCGGCHVSHGSGGAISGALRASDASSICLNCHTGAGTTSISSVLSFDGSALTPGGDFYWMTKSFVWTGGSSPAAMHGHNVVARDFGLVPDPVRVQSPGGNYPAARLSCISCHDPHGRSGGGTRAGAAAVSVSGSYGAEPGAGSRSGNYRLLGGAGYEVNGFVFSNPAPIARQNAAQPFTESDDSHVDYGTGMSEWCANCHAQILNGRHQVGGQGFEHPVGGNDPLSSAIIANYNSYLKTGDLSGTAATAYLQFVPFERGVSSPAFLDPNSTSGPDSSSRISCLTCHRAHASAFRNAGRWDFDAALLINSHPSLGDSGVSGSDVTNSYYGRNIASDFGMTQGQFCEKCHGGATP